METGGGGSRKVSMQKADSNRTLLDIIRDDPTSGGGHGKEGKRSWRHFKEKLRLHRSGSGRGSAWTSTLHTPTSDIPINHRQYTNAASNNNRMMARRTSARYSSAGEATQPDISAVPDVDIELMSNRGSRAPRLEKNISRAMERNMSRTIERNMSQASGKFEHTNSLAMRRSRGLEEHDDNDDSDETPKSAEHKEGESINGDEEGEKDDGGEKKPMRMSLMALLAETEGSAYTMEEEDEDEEEEDDRGGGGGGGGGEYSNCCICMVRHKGAAFIPCGHTFCRLCSRELCGQRGNCPLCNNYILEILDIF